MRAWIPEANRCKAANKSVESAQLCPVKKTLKVALTAYVSASDAGAMANPLTFEKAFTLGTANATIEVPIQ